MKLTKAEALKALRALMTPDRFNENGLAYDTKIPGPIIQALLRDESSAVAWGAGYKARCDGENGNPEKPTQNPYGLT